MVSRGSVGVKPEVPPICSRKSNLLESAAPHSLLDILGAAAASSWASMTTRFLLADKLFAGFLSPVSYTHLRAHETGAYL
eukprot:8002951-Pyramimonas_sp.AAC.2